MYLKSGFIIIALLLAVLLAGYESYLLIKKEGRKNHPVYVAFMTGMLVLYILCAFAGVFIIKGGLNKFIMLLFALSPFVVGKLATYEKRTLFCIIQVCRIILSAIFILIVQ